MLTWDHHHATLERNSAVVAQALTDVDAAIEHLLRQTPDFGPWVHDATAFQATVRAIRLRLERLHTQLTAAERALPDAGPAAGLTRPAGDGAGWAHRIVSIQGRVSFEVTTDLTERDPVTAELAGGQFTEGDMVSLMLSLLRPGATVLDLGAHVGGYSLAAAAAGARVIAVVASPRRAEALRTSARRNRFHQLLVIEAAVADVPGIVDFPPIGAFGHIVGHAGEETVAVPTVTVSELVKEVGWEPVSFVKIDVEGAELSAFRGMQDLLSGPDAPPVLFESNGHMLAARGLRPRALLEHLDALGYTSYRVDTVAGHLVAVPPEEIQPEAVTGYLAMKGLPTELLAQGWQVRNGYSFDELVARILAQGNHPLPQHTAYILDVLSDGDPALLAHPAVAEVLKALRAASP